MKLGFTYDLIDDYLRMGYSKEEAAECDKIETIDAIDETLCGLGHTVERIGSVHHLLPRLIRGDRWDLVFNIAEGFHGVGREALIPALLDAYQIPYTFSDPLVLALTLHKGMTKSVIRDRGLPTPDFQVVASVEELDGFALPFPVFVKPVAEGTGKGISARSMVVDRDELTTRTLELVHRFRQPVLVETFLPGREFTVGLIGSGRATQVIGVMEVLFNEQAEAHAYSYQNKDCYLDRVTYRLVSDGQAQQAALVAREAWSVLACRDAGRVDLRADDSGMPNFIEVNPLAGLNPIHSDLPILCRLAGMDFATLIGHIVEQAQSRILPPILASAS